MRHFYYLGCHEGDCCIIESLVQITEENFTEVIPFCKIYSTSWGGRDRINRTCEKESFSRIGDYIHLRDPYTYTYHDYDHGCHDTGSFRFSRLQEVVRRSRNVE